MAMQQVYNQEFNAGQITIPQAPAGDDSLLIVSAETSGGMVPAGVASQWLTTGYGMTWVGIGPFSGSVITVNIGRNPPPVVRRLQEYEVV